MTDTTLIPLSDIQTETCELVLKLGLKDFHSALISQYELPGAYDNQIFEARLKELLISQIEGNQVQRFNKLRYAAKFADCLPLNNITIDSARGVTERLITSINSLNWYRSKETLMITGSTGTGKTALLCAIGLHLCRHGIPVRYFRTRDFLESYKNRTSAGQIRYRDSLKKFRALIFDDFGVSPFNNADMDILFEILTTYYGKTVFLIGTQIDGGGVIAGMENIAAGATADAVIDRLSKPMRSIKLIGESLRGRTCHNMELKEEELEEMKL